MLKLFFFFFFTNFKAIYKWKELNIVIYIHLFLWGVYV